MEITITIKIEDEELKDLLGLQVKPTAHKGGELSEYARLFDGVSAAWTNDPECNKRFLLQQQYYANEKLRARGYLFLNEVYDMLDLSRTKAGQVIGWIYNMDNPVGDNYVDFDLFNPRNRDFVNGYEKSVLLDFNVDGNILEYI